MSGKNEAAVIALACQIVKLRDRARIWKQTALTLENEAMSARADAVARAEADRVRIEGLAKELRLERETCTETADLLNRESEKVRGLSVQAQDQRSEIERLRDEAAKYKTERDHFYQREGIEAKKRMDVADERDALRAEVEFLKTLRPKYKVGDKLQLYPAIRYTPVTVVGVRTVYDCQADGAEYPVGHSEDELTERYEQTPPEATHAEPDLTQLHAKGKEAWSDVPNATQWVEEMRGNSEATHDTEAGKAVAESAVSETVADEIKVGDVVKVVGASGDLTAQSDIGKIGEVLQLDSMDGAVRLSGGAGWVNHRDVRKVTT